MAQHFGLPFFLATTVLTAGWLLGSNHAPQNAAPLGVESKRPVTMADAIKMTRFADPNLDGRVAQYSPDGTKFVVVLRKGDLNSNTNEYSILLWRTNELFRSPKPEVLVRMSSSSNRPAIGSITWRDDNETILFLGENPGELQQLFSFNTHALNLEKLTASSTNVLSYSVSAANNIAYVAEELGSGIDEKVRRFGLPVTTQLITEVLLGHPDEFWSDHVRLCVQSSIRNGIVKTLSNKVLMPFRSPDERPLLSPNGQYLLLFVNVERIPPRWKDYRDSRMQKYTSWKTTAGQYSVLRQYVLFDTRTGESKVLLDSPLNNVSGGGVSEAAWSPDSSSVAITNTYLPLDNVTPEEREVRLARPFSVEMKISSGEITKISSDEIRLLKWDANTNELIFEEGRHNQNPNVATQVLFRKHGLTWEKITQNLTALKNPGILLEEGMNTPPKIVAIDPDSKERALLLDLNPQFKQLQFGHEEQLRWKAKDGHEVDGGLYYPANYVPGRRYPLVIQTHGFRSDRFQIDGPYTSTFAAQALAGKDIMVLQAEQPRREELLSILSTPKEAGWRMAAYEGAIDYLDNRGLIDPTRVGIIGFSRTCWHVKYTLTHSHYHFTAASISDGFDLGYLAYAMMANRSYPDEEMDQIIGARPSGDALQSWFRESPGFNIDKMSGSTPMRIVASYPLDVLIEWEWFSMMKRIGKPVDMVVFLDGVHVLQKPSNRMISQDGTVDWFDFWLNGHEDADPAKAEQYARWSELRKQQGQNSSQPVYSGPP